MGKTHLYFTDCHADPKHANDRFDWLGRLIVDRQPDRVICGGDFGNFDSLSSYDRGKRSSVGATWKDDVDVVLDAQARLMGPVHSLNELRRKHKEKQYRPHWKMLGGNHCQGRMEKVLQEDWRLEGTVGVAAQRFEENGWDYTDFRKTAFIDGIGYSHYFTSGAMGRAIGPPNVGNKLIKKNMTSSVVGHNHYLDVANQSRADGKRIWGISAGCYMDFTPEYAKDSAQDWWRGILILHGVEDGDFTSFELLTMNQIRGDYGNVHS